MKAEELLSLDREYLWHPYSSTNSDQPIYPVKKAQGVMLELTDGRKLIDGMSSWWSVLHGYNHPELNKAIEDQLANMAHVMFGGLTHEPAVKLGKTLVELTPEGLDKVFICDSGSVAVEVAMKMAIQYWQSQNQDNKHQFLSLKKGYHGDTFAAMSVCDPVTGMHHMFSKVLSPQIFSESPQCGFNDTWQEKFIIDFKTKIQTHHQQLAAVILEPIVQGTGGMRFYSPEFLKQVKYLCEEFDVLLIADEIATGLGRTGEMFACNHASISPDIMCLGKTLTAGYISLAATLCSNKIANTICNGESGVFMHGPTFMGNPLACAVANKSLELLVKSDWKSEVKRIELNFKDQLQVFNTLSVVESTRQLGGIGVVELKEPVDSKKLLPEFINQGIWLRPFGKLVYSIPPYTISDNEQQKLMEGAFNALKRVYK